MQMKQVILCNNCEAEGFDTFDFAERRNARFLCRGLYHENAQSFGYLLVILLCGFVFGSFDSKTYSRSQG